MSLFSGCGGLDLGFHEEGFQSIYAVDNDPAAIAVYRKNIGVTAWVRDVTSRLFHDEIRKLGRVDVVLGGFPCQGFSKAGPKNSADQRNTLYLEMLRAVSRLRPRIFVAENVDGLSQNFGGAFVRSITEDFAAAGYTVKHQIIDAVGFGVPQHRRRIIFTGYPVGQPDFCWPEPTHELPRRNGESIIENSVETLWDFMDKSAAAKAVTIRQALAGLPSPQMSGDHSVTNSWPQKYEPVMKAIGPGQKLCNVRHSTTSVYTWDIPEVFGAISKEQRQILETIAVNRRHKRYGSIPNGNPLSRSDIADLLGAEASDSDIEKLTQQGYLKKIDDKFDLKGAMFCSGMFKRPFWDEPAPTVLTNFHNPRYFLHPGENRPFTLRECARLQGFPDSFQFTNAGISLEDGYRLVGNAVPPILSRVLAKSVKFYLQNTESGISCAA